jgi:hypothetical protein
MIYLRILERENNIASKHPQIVQKMEVAMKESHVESPIFPFIK